MAASRIETLDWYRLNARLAINGADNGTHQLQVTGTVYFPSLGNFATDAAAAAGSVAIGQLYRNGNIVQVRVV